jgi:hypothetical protein
MGSWSHRSSPNDGASTAGRGRCQAGSNPATVSRLTTPSRNRCCFSRSRCCRCCCCCCCTAGAGASALLPLDAGGGTASSAAPGCSSGSQRPMAARLKLLVPSRLTGDLKGEGREQRDVRTRGATTNSNSRGLRLRQRQQYQPPPGPVIPSVHSLLQILPLQGRHVWRRRGAQRLSRQRKRLQREPRDRRQRAALQQLQQQASLRYAGARVGGPLSVTWRLQGGGRLPTAKVRVLASTQQLPAHVQSSRLCRRQPKAEAMALSNQGAPRLTSIRNEMKGLSARPPPLKASQRTYQSARRWGVARRALPCGGAGGGVGGGGVAWRGKCGRRIKEDCCCCCCCCHVAVAPGHQEAEPWPAAKAVDRLVQQRSSNALPSLCSAAPTH